VLRARIDRPQDAPRAQMRLQRQGLKAPAWRSADDCDIASGSRHEPNLRAAQSAAISAHSGGPAPAAGGTFTTAGGGRKGHRRRAPKRAAMRWPTASTPSCATRLVPVQIWQGRAQSLSGCGGGEKSPGADVAGMSPVPAQMWQGEPCPGADVAGASAVPVRVWRGRDKCRWCR
jgi:hypothetical protein